MSGIDIISIFSNLHPLIHRGQSWNAPIRFCFSEAKWEEIDALNDDIEKFAETFAEQRSELERFERKNNKLQLEVTRLKIENAEKALKISELEAYKKNFVWSEIEKISSDINRN